MASPVVAFKALGSTLLDRIQWMRQAGISFKGARDLYEVLGYPRILTTRQYRDRYARGGVAGRIVDALPNATWRGDMELVEDEDPQTNTNFEQMWNDLNTRLQINAKFQRVDKLSRLSTYAVLLIGAPGELSDELPKGTPEQLLYLMPFTGGGGPNSNMRHDSDIDADATIASFETAADNPRFGLPATYQLRRTDVSSPILQRPVHWSRIIHIAENVMDDEVYGQPALERVWNLLDDLDKVTGGGAEAFWLRANQGLHVDIDKDMAIGDAKKEKDDLKEQAEDYKHQMTRWLRTRGVRIDTLSSDVANFLGPADAILTQIAGACAMPKRILTGSEMGELASSQDRDNWKDQINGRQTGYAGPYIVRPLVDRLIQYGYLPTPKQYEVRWPHIQVLTEQEKAEGAKKWADINTASGGMVFSFDEIRDKWYQMDPGPDEVTDSYKAAGAEKWAMTNKTQGATIFTDDEIRETWYGKPPLTPEQKVPITAPERVSSTAPTPPNDTVGGKGTPPKALPTPGAFPRAAADGGEPEFLHVLSDAIKANNLDVIDRILGMRHAYSPDQPRDQNGQFSATGFSVNVEKAYSDAYQQSGGKMDRLSASQAQKLHSVLSAVESALYDPEVATLVYQALQGTTGSNIHDRLVTLESGLAKYIGGQGAPPLAWHHESKDIATGVIRQMSANTALEGVRKLIALFEDPSTRPFVEWALTEISKAGSLDAFKQQLRTAEFDESKHPRAKDGKFGSGGAEWQSAGGFEHTGITWKQPTDLHTGRPIPIKVNSVEEAIPLVLDGKVVEVKDTLTAYTLINKLADMANEAKAAGKEAKDYDLCNVSVAGSNMFCGDTIRNKEYPNGISRIEMPQLGGKPVPGSEADTLPRNPWDKSEVDGSQAFLAHLQGIGVRTSLETIPAANLHASQREMIGSKVAAMMRDTSFDPAKNPIFISSDNYVVDGHHRWAAVVGRDAANGQLGDSMMQARRVNAPISEVLHLASAWSEKFGIQQAAGVKQQSKATGLRQ